MNLEEDFSASLTTQKSDLLLTDIFFDSKCTIILTE